MAHFTACLLAARCHKDKTHSQDASESGDCFLAARCRKNMIQLQDAFRIKDGAFV